MRTSREDLRREDLFFGSTAPLRQVCSAISALFGVGDGGVTDRELVEQLLHTHNKHVPSLVLADTNPAHPKIH